MTIREIILTLEGDSFAEALQIRFSALLKPGGMVAV